MLISCSSSDKNIKIWSIYTFECIKILAGHSNTINSLEATANGRLISCSTDKSVKLWQIETGKMLETIQFDCSVNCLKILTDDLIAIGLDSGKIQIYDLSKCKTLKIISAHVLNLFQLNFLSNKNLMSVCGNGEIKLWKIFD